MIKINTVTSIVCALVNSFEYSFLSNLGASSTLADEAELSKLPPGSDLQQDAVVAIQEEDPYNWGYSFFCFVSFFLSKVHRCVIKYSNTWSHATKGITLCFGEFRKEAMQVTQMVQIVL